MGKYINYLESRGWSEPTVLDTNLDFRAEIENSYTEIYGWGSSPELALEDLEKECESYVTGIERSLNLELVP